MGASITSDKYGVKGDNGLATVPKHLRGTWYNRRGKKLVIDAHSINGGEIHKISGSLHQRHLNKLEDGLEPEWKISMGLIVITFRL